MTANVNKDISHFKENFFYGLSKRQAFAFGSILLLIFISMWARDYVGGEFVAALCYIGIFPIAVIGFYQRDGLKGEEFMALLARQYRMKRELGLLNQWEDTRPIRRIEIDVVSEEAADPSVAIEPVDESDGAQDFIEDTFDDINTEETNIEEAIVQ